MRPLVALLVLLCSFPLLAAPGDVPLSPVLPAPLTGIVDAAVATSGGEFMVVFGRYGGVYSQRVALDGSPIDPRPIHLDWQTHGYPVRVAWTGTAYLVVWAQPGSLVGQHIGRDGALSPRFTIASGTVIGLDVLGGGGEAAILSKGERTFLHIVDHAGNVTRSWPIENPSPSLVRIQDAWRVLVHPYTSALHLLDPETGTTTMLWPSFSVDVVFASPAGGALAYTRSREIGVVTPDGAFKRISVEGELDVDWWGPTSYASPTPEGWAFFYRSEGRSRVASVLLNGTVASDREIAGEIPARHYSSHVAAAGPDLRRHLLVRPGWPGLDSALVVDAFADPTPSYAVGDAAQHSAAIARAPGMDLVVWNEAVDRGWTLRATRVAGDRPLDGEGIVIASGFPHPARAIFDGETFAVVWDQAEGTFFRRIAMDGRMIEPAPVLLDAENGVSTLATAGGGEFLVGWQFGGKVAIVRNGAPLPRIDLWPDPRILGLFAAAASRDAYFVVSADAVPGCRITCPDPDIPPIYARFLARDGSQAGAALKLPLPTNSLAGPPVAAADSWFLPVDLPGGSAVIRVGDSAPLITGTPSLPGTLRSTSTGIEIVGWAGGRPFRGLLTPEPKTLWYEPLPVDSAAGERLAGVLSSETSLLVETGQRYVLRPIGTRRNADLAIVHRARREAVPMIVDDVTIEHRGGDAVDAIYVQVRSSRGYLTPTASRPIVNGRIEGPFLPGESIELSISGLADTREARRIVVLPDARDVAAADNFLEIASNGPMRERRRAVAR